LTGQIAAYAVAYAALAIPHKWSRQRRAPACRRWPGPG